MTISKSSWQKYISALRKVNDKATEEVLYYLQEFGIPQTRDEMLDLIAVAYRFSQIYGEAAATLAAEWYDDIVAVSNVFKPPAVPAKTPTYGEVAKAIQGTCKTGNEKIISGSIGRLVKRTGVDTTMQNALRDGAQWAWIPVGDTCAFCLTLASRGWQRASKKAIKGGHAEHIHQNCDCTYAIRFDDSSNVAGYDPSYYQDLYYNAPLDEWNTPDGEPPAGDTGAERNTPQNRINAMRRAQYARDKEQINAAARINYAERKELERNMEEN